MFKHFLTLLILLCMIGTAQGFVFNDNPNLYDYSNGVMTDNTGLTYETNINGVVTVNSERFLGFALKGTYAGTEYTYTSMDYEWTWTHTEIGTDHVFEAINNNDNFVWKQYWYFYENKPMKIEHYLKNNYAQSITDMQMYYIMTVEDTDVIEYNETEYLVGDVKPLHIQKNLNNVDASINFNSEFDFNFMDMISDGFDINEFYLGSGSVIDKPLIDIMAMGFTKGDRTLNSGDNILIDPTFSTLDTGRIRVIPLDSDKIVVAWYEGGVYDDVRESIYYLNGTLVDNNRIDSNAGDCDGVSVSAFNSTRFVVGWHDQAGTDSAFIIYDDNGNVITGPIVVDSYNVNCPNWVSAFNETHFVFTYTEGVDDVMRFVVYDINGNLITGPIEIAYDISDDDYIVSTALNETHFVVSWRNTSADPHVVSFSIFDSGGNLISGTTVVDSPTGWPRPSIATLNETTFVVGWADRDETDSSFSIYDSSSNLLVGPIDVDNVEAHNFVASINETHFVSIRLSGGELRYSLYDSGGNLIIGSTVIDDSVSGNYWHVCANETTTGISLPENVFVVAYEKTTSNSIWIPYYVNGTVYDVSLPAYSDESTNTTETGNPCLFSIKYDDNIWLGDYIFSTNNTGSWVNDSVVGFSSTPETITTTKTLNFTVDTIVGYRWYANDSAGNINNTPIYTLTTTVSNYIPPNPITLQNSTDDFYVNYTWEAGAGNVTDSYNVSYNGTWDNTSSNTFRNESVGAHGYLDIVVYAYNNSGTGTLSAGYLSDNVTVSNNPIVISDVSTSYTLDEGNTLSIDANYSDADGDTGTFDDNSTQWNINNTTGIVSWLTVKGDVGIYNYYINVSDGYGNTSTQAFNVTVNNLDNFTFNNSGISPALVRKNEPFTVSVDINDSDGTINATIVKIEGTNYTMTNTANDTWSYTFTGTSIPTRYDIDYFYAQDDSGQWNSTSSELYIDVLPSTGTGSTGGGYYIPPTPTPVPTATPTPEPTEIPPTEEVEEVIEVITDKVVETLDVKKSGITMELIILVTLVAVLIYYANRRKKNEL